MVLLVAFGLYAGALNRTFQYDEAYTLRHFAVNPGIALLSYTEPNNHMLHSLLVWISRTLAGESLVAIRFPAFASALLSIAMMYRVGRRLGGWRLGVTAAVFLAITPAFAEYATLARGYTLSIFLTLVLIDRVFLGKPKRTRAYRYSVLLTCLSLILTLPTMVMLIGAALAWLLLKARRERIYRLALPPIILGSIMGAMFYVPAFLVGSFSRSAGRFGLADVQSSISDWVSLVFFFAPFYTGIAFYVAALVGLPVMIFRRKRRLLEMVLFAFGAALLGAVAQQLVLGSSYYGRNALYLLPLVCLLAGLVVAALPRMAAPWVALALLVLSVQPLQGYLSRQTTVGFVLDYLDTETQPSDMLLFSTFADEPMFYYLEAGGQWERLMLTPDKQRLLIFTETGNDDIPALLDVYGLRAYVHDCHRAYDSDDYWYQNPFVVQACSFTDAAANQ